MVHEALPIDARTVPDVPSLVHEVDRRGQSRLVQADGVIVRVSPTRRRRRLPTEPTQEEFAAAMNATFGSLKGLIDPEAFRRQRRALQVDDREPRTG